MGARWTTLRCMASPLARALPRHIRSPSVVGRLFSSRPVSRADDSDLCLRHRSRTHTSAIRVCLRGSPHPAALHVGEWLAIREEWKHFTDLPEEVRQFAANPLNIGFIHIAKALAEMPTEKLREVGESVLNITM